MSTTAKAPAAAASTTAGQVADHWGVIWQARWLTEKSVWSQLEIPALPELLDEPVPEVIVTGLFQQILGRKPDPDGLANNVNAIRDGVDPGIVAAIIASSPEARDNHPRRARRARWIADNRFAAPGATRYPPLLDEAECGGVPFDDWLLIHSAFLGCTGRPPTGEQFAGAVQWLAQLGREGLLREVAATPQARSHLFGEAPPTVVQPPPTGSRRVELQRRVIGKVSRASMQVSGTATGEQQVAERVLAAARDATNAAQARILATLVGR